MVELDYTSLSRQQRLAIFLIVIGPEAAAEVMRHFNDGQAEHLCREMGQFPTLSESIQREALEEFSELISQSASSALGGLPYAQRALGLAKGDGTASTIMDRLSPVGRPVQVIKEIEDMEGRQIFNLLKAEQPQTIAFVLSHLDSNKASEVFPLFSPEIREDVIERLGTIESTSIALVDKISQSLGRRLNDRTKGAYHHSGGIRSVAGLLKQLGKPMTKNLLSKLDERNAKLSAAVRKQMFSFDELARLSGNDIQRLLREIDSAQLATALKGASEAMRSKVYGSLSKRAAEGLREEMEMLSGIKHKDIEAAQDAIIQSARKLEDEGQITLDGETAEPAAAAS